MRLQTSLCNDFFKTKQKIFGKLCYGEKNEPLTRLLTDASAEYFYVLIFIIQ